jgi:hypothetical protein
MKTSNALHWIFWMASAACSAQTPIIGPDDNRDLSARESARQSADAFAAQPAVRVRLVDEVNLSLRDREAFQTKAQEILLGAGVASTWLDCPLKTSSETPPGCVEPLTGPDVVIRILPVSMVGNGRALGSSVAGRDGGAYGLIYYPNVAETAKIVEIAVPVMLALATVHEMGHLVLGSQAHWPAGIMHPCWDRKEVADMIRMNHFFNKSQCGQLQTRLLTRALPR